MSMREEILLKVQTLPDNSLATVLDFVEKVEKSSKGPSLMQRLREIKIEGPRDFSRNIDMYLNGEKRADENLERRY